MYPCYQLYMRTCLRKFRIVANLAGEQQCQSTGYISITGVMRHLEIFSCVGAAGFSLLRTFYSRHLLPSHHFLDVGTLTDNCFGCGTLSLYFWYELYDFFSNFVTYFLVFWSINDYFISHVVEYHFFVCTQFVDFKSEVENFLGTKIIKKFTSFFFFYFIVSFLYF